MSTIPLRPEHRVVLRECYSLASGQWHSLGLNGEYEPFPQRVPDFPSYLLCYLGLDVSGLLANLLVSRLLMMGEPDWVTGRWRMPDGRVLAAGLQREQREAVYYSICVTVNDEAVKCAPSDAKLPFGNVPKVAPSRLYSAPASSRFPFGKPPETYRLTQAGRDLVLEDEPAMAIREPLSFLGELRGVLTSGEGFLDWLGKGGVAILGGRGLPRDELTSRYLYFKTIWNAVKDRVPYRASAPMESVFKYIENPNIPPDPVRHFGDDMRNRFGHVLDMFRAEVNAASGSASWYTLGAFHSRYHAFSEFSECVRLADTLDARLCFVSAKVGLTQHGDDPRTVGNAVRASFVAEQGMTAEDAGKLPVSEVIERLELRPQSVMNPLGNPMEGYAGYAPADTIRLDHGISSSRLSEGKTKGKIKTRPAPSGLKDTQGKNIHVLYHVEDAKEYASPKRKQAPNPRKRITKRS